MSRGLAAAQLGRISITGGNSEEKKIPSVAGVLTPFKADSDEDQDPRTKIPLTESPFLNRYSQMKEVPCTPPRKRISGDGYNAKKAVVPSTDKSASPFREPSDDISCSADDASVRDSGFWEQSVEAGTFHSSPWSTQQRQSSSPCSEYDDSVGQADWESLVGANPSKERRFAAMCKNTPVSNQGTPQNLLGGANLPSYIKLGPEKRVSAGNEAHDEDEERTVYGSLFEQPEPWNTVGFIIGLPRIIAAEKNSRCSSLPLDCNSQPENTGFETTTVVSRARVDGLRHDDEDYEEDFDSLFDGPWGTSSPMLQSSGMDVVEVDMSPRLSSRDLTSLTSPARSFVEDLGGIDDLLEGDHEIQPLDYESSTSQRESTKQPNAALYAGSGASDSGTFENSNDGRAEENSGQNYVPQRDRDELVGVDGSEKVMDCGDNEGGRNFNLPSLREVNGRFVGPTLFDDFDDSEEE